MIKAIELVVLFTYHLRNSYSQTRNDGQFGRFHSLDKTVICASFWSEAEVTHCTCRTTGQCTSSRTTGSAHSQTWTWVRSSMMGEKHLAKNQMVLLSFSFNIVSWLKNLERMVQKISHVCIIGSHDKAVTIALTNGLL